MRRFLIGVVVGILLGVGLTSLFIKKDLVEKEVVVEVDVLVPDLIVEKDTVYLPSPIPKSLKIDSTYYYKYIDALNDSKKDSIFMEAIIINEYKEKIEDDTIVIDIYSKVRGTLLNYQVGYKIKERSIPIKTTVTVPIPRTAEFYLGGKVGIPWRESTLKPTVAPGFLLINKKHTKTYQFNYDLVNKGLEFGFYFRL